MSCGGGHLWYYNRHKNYQQGGANISTLVDAQLQENAGVVKRYIGDGDGKACEA